MTDTAAAQTSVPRRGVLCGALLLGVAGAGVLAGCSSGPSSAGGAGTGGGTAGNGAGGTSPAPAGTVLTDLAAVPVGGGTAVRVGSTVVIVTQPEQGTVKAFNARCTHQGSLVRPPEDGVMTCPSHNSQFRATDGGVVQGPATRPLQEIAVTVKAGKVTLA